MTTRPYSECLAQALALCGVPDANTTEVARVKTFINRRARQAYGKSELWPRWLVVGEERIVSEEGLLPYSQDGLRDIGTIQRIHESEPFKSDPAGEYVDWNAQDDGVQITGYQSADGTTIDYIDVSGSEASLQLNGRYYRTGEVNSRPFFSSTNVPPSSHSGTAIPAIYYHATEGWKLNTYSLSFLPGWYSDSVTDDPTEGDWTPENFLVTGTLVTDVTYDKIAFITYKAAFSTTYGDGEDDEDEVPEEWFEWMATGASASFLFSDKETEAALLLEAQAQEDLDDQLAKISRQNGAHLQTRILSHGNMQAR